MIQSRRTHLMPPALHQTKEIHHGLWVQHFAWIYHGLRDGHPVKTRTKIDVRTTYVEYSKRVMLQKRVQRWLTDGTVIRRILIGPIGLDEVPQVPCFLPVVQGNDLRDSVSHPRLILVCVNFRAAGEVESRVTGLGQDCGVPRGVVGLGEGSVSKRRPLSGPNSQP